MGRNLMLSVKGLLILSILASAIALVADVSAVRAQTLVSGRMVLDQGTASWEKYVWRPTVLQLDPLNYAMWYSGQDDSGVSRVGVAFSSDGLAWARYSGNPILAPSASGWDSGSVQEQWVIHEDGNYKMWYTGETLDGNGNPVYVGIGYATSKDGIHWIKWPGPVLTAGPSGSWDDDSVFRPTVIPTTPGYLMYYEGKSSVTGAIRIGSASSNNGTDWVRTTQPMSIPPGPSKWSNYYLGGSYRIVDQYVLLVYGSQGGDQLSQIGFAKSPNGNNWDPYAANPIVTSGPPGTWYDDGVILPSMAIVGSNYYIYYTGFEKSAGSRIGLSILPMSSTPIPEFPFDPAVIAGIVFVSAGLFSLSRKRGRNPSARA